MASFAFTARDASGQPQTGTQSAESPAALVAVLRARGWVVLDVQEEPSTANAGAEAGSLDLSWLSPAKLLPATKFDVEFGLRQIAAMIRAGITLLSALETAADQARRPRMAAVWRDIRDRIQEGVSFSDALARHPTRFPTLVIQLAKAGEQSGTLEVVLERAADQLERSRQLKTTLISALMYPGIVVTLALAVAAFMVLKVIPVMQKFLGGQGRRLPAITQALVDISNWFQEWLPTLATVTGAATVALVVLYRYNPTGRHLDRLLLRVPLIGMLFRIAGTAMLARSLGLMIDNGVVLLDALATVTNLLGNRAQAERIALVRNSVLTGGSVSKPLLAGREFLPMLGRMVAVGEETGTLGTTLNEVARFHEQQLEAWVRRLSVLIEPVVTLVVGGIVGFVYIAFFVALFSLSGGVR